jgi:hypothetical protein
VKILSLSRLATYLEMARSCGSRDRPDATRIDVHAGAITSYNFNAKGNLEPYLDEPLAVRQVGLTEGSFRVSEAPVNKSPQSRRLRSGRRLHRHSHPIVPGGFDVMPYVTG